MEEQQLEQRQESEQEHDHGNEAHAEDQGEEGDMEVSRFFFGRFDYISIGS